MTKILYIALTGIMFLLSSRIIYDLLTWKGTQPISQTDLPKKNKTVTCEGCGARHRDAVCKYCGL